MTEPGEDIKYELTTLLLEYKNAQADDDGAWHAGTRIQSAVDAIHAYVANTVREAVEAERTRVYEGIQAVLFDYTVQGLTDEDGGSVKLVDLLSSGDDLESGHEEISLICDAIHRDALSPAMAPDRFSAMCECGHTYGVHVDGDDGPCYVGGVDLCECKQFRARSSEAGV